ncbi:cytochrome c maturation protein CcmE domain-containing protein [Pedobacter metabolipauper]|uniref:Cytochrome c-type biogenesis protein CcmE n=1 Tax=Pedobacter metabolipauper TaxID=425513 RepID=A0A4R6SUB0_9SPHI|nr:cytochrome c maturation protein CcmE [Pedobacter metabolipauper]TDQ08533.1 cytochrome c-type biogenesis protein CcmE [Pedobacter metabolipauper]
MRKSAIIGLITIALCVGFLISLNADTSSYSTFTEAAKDAREFHVMGFWEKKQGIYYNAQKDANHFSFHMKDQDGLVKRVVYNGTKPQDFERSEKLVLIGEMKAGVFYASKILMKCPSKYNNDLVEVKQDGKVEKYN